MRLDWRTQTVLLTGMLLVMETIAAYALISIVMVMAAVGDERRFVAVVAVVLASWLISRLLASMKLAPVQLRLWATLISIGALATILRVEFAGDLRLWDTSWIVDLVRDPQTTLRVGMSNFISAPILAALWVRGLLRGQDAVEFDTIVGTFIFGILITGLAALIVDTGGDMPRELGWLAGLYVVIGLSSIGLAHVTRSDGGEFSLPRRTAILVGGIVLGLTAVVLVPVVLVLLAGFDGVQDAMILAGRGIGFLLAGAFYVVTWPLLAFAQLFANVDFGSGGERTQPDIVWGEEPEAGFDLVRLITIVLTCSLIGSLLLWFWISFAIALQERIRRKSGGLKAPISERSHQPRGMARLFKSVVRRQRRRSDELEPVRRLYFDVLEEGERCGIQRSPTDTPLELASRLAQALGPEPSGSITQVFADVRYGRLTPDPAEVHRLRQAWSERLDGLQRRELNVNADGADKDIETL